MKLIDYLESANITNVKFAEIVGVSPGMVSQWINETRPVSPERCVIIEKKTKKQVTRQDLRPNDYWLIWPELKKPNGT